MNQGDKIGSTKNDPQITNGSSYGEGRAGKRGKGNMGVMKRESEGKLMKEGGFKGEVRGIHNPYLS